MSINSGKAVINACKKLEYKISEFHLSTNKIDNILPELKKLDFVFLALHGVFGEDGSIQAILDKSSIKYNGSCSSSSKNCFDKSFTKRLAKDNNILTPCFTVIDKKNFDNFKFNFRKSVIKPNKQGSSVGFSVIDDKDKIFDAIDLALEYDSHAIIEEFIEGREITVSILGDEVLPIIEIKPNDGIYDYKSKYTKGASNYLCPANISESKSEEIKNIAIKIHQLSNCKVYSRVDFRLDKNNKCWLLEINTLPGMTETSLFPMAAKAIGLSFEDLIDKIIKLSIEK